MLLNGHSQYGAITLHSDQLGAALLRLGHGVSMINLLESGSWDRFVAALAGQPDLCVSLNGVGSDSMYQGQSAFDHFKCAYASIHFDHPAYLLPRLETPIRRKAAFFVDNSHVAFLRFGSLGRDFADIGLLPAGATQTGVPPDLTDGGYRCRDIDLLFTGTYRGEPPRRWRDEPASPGRDLMELIADQMAADATLPVLAALQLALKARFQADLTPDFFDSVRSSLHMPQLFAEAYHRNRVIEALGQAGTPMTLYGTGWDALTDRFPSFDYRGVGSVNETLALLGRSLLVLNINNGFVDGGHERVFTAMAAGAAVVSDANDYYRRQFADDEIALYRWSKLDQLPDKIERLISQREKTVAMARAGFRKVRARHLWDHRAERIIACVKALKSLQK